MLKSELMRMEKEYKGLPYITKLTLPFIDFLFMKCDDDLSPKSNWDLKQDMLKPPLPSFSIFDASKKTVKAIDNLSKVIKL